MANVQEKNIVVLISGSGTNLQAIIDACENGQINGNVVAVISNKRDVKGLLRAQNHDIPAITLEHSNYESREAFDEALAECIDEYKPDLVVLAGFMRILSTAFVEHFSGKMLNIHPSLLPKYPGLNTHKRAIENGDALHGVSVHFVTAELDGGPVVLQSQVEVELDDTVESLASKVAQKEWIIYPTVVSWFCDNKLYFENDHAYLDKIKIKNQGILYESMVGESTITT